MRIHGASFQRSLQLLDQAISLDPNYARAYAIKFFRGQQPGECSTDCGRPDERP